MNQFEERVHALKVADRRNKRPNKLPIEQREQLTAYFMRRYPCTKKIKVGSNDKRAYNVRVHYREGDVNRTFVVSAYTYESLVICVEEMFSQRLSAVI